MRNDKLFKKEELIAQHYRQLLASGKHVDNPLIREMSELLAHYEKLLKKFDRITKVGDKQHSSLLEIAKIDALTGLCNRKHLDAFLKKEWQRAMELKTPLVLIMVDIDYFKLYNDEYGHQAGDGCLKQVADILLGALKRSSDMVARYGGEEFTIVLRESSLNFAIETAESIQKTLHISNIPHARSQVEDRVTLSMGIATQIPNQHSDLSMLIHNADDALYRAKQTGRNKYYVYQIYEG